MEGRGREQDWVERAGQTDAGLTGLSQSPGKWAGLYAPPSVNHWTWAPLEGRALGRGSSAQVRGTLRTLTAASCLLTFSLQLRPSGWQTSVFTRVPLLSSALSTVCDDIYQRDIERCPSPSTDLRNQTTCYSRSDARLIIISEFGGLKHSHNENAENDNVNYLAEYINLNLIKILQNFF